ncbi:MAG: hypothetical protein JXA92_00790 [candidate division Zixibacteria bacterium]|nr:hypothetical protein [candidate division Zixibacteria bacterium]
MLAVGDSTRLEIIFNTGYYRGLITKSPALFTNETDSVRRVSIKTDVVVNPDSTSPLIISPYKLSIYQFGDMLVDSMAFEVTNVSDKDIILSVIDIPDDLMELNLVNRIDAGETVRGVVRLRETAYEMTFDKSITLEVDGKVEGVDIRYTIPIVRRIIP